MYKTFHIILNEFCLDTELRQCNLLWEMNFNEGLMVERMITDCRIGRSDTVSSFYWVALQQRFVSGLGKHLLQHTAAVCQICHD